MKKILLNEIYFEHESSLYGPQDDEAARWAARQIGRETPEFALTMVGRRRLDNVHRCVAAVLEEAIPGDLMECGVCRGGVAILMRSILHAYGITDRSVWVADSFQGVPAPKADLYPADRGLDLHDREDLAVALVEVQKNFARFDLLDGQVKFIEGFFADSLPGAPVGDLAVLRLDGDLYESTYVCLVNLYERVSPGGFVIVDDYNCYECCRRAVQDFARERGLAFNIQDIDGWGAYWRKEGTPRIHAASTSKCHSDSAIALFDAAYYLRTYPDVAAAGVDPYGHFLQSGFREGRNPHPLFDTSYYLEQYPDVAASGANPLVDYWESGAAQGRDPHPLFETSYYAGQAQLAGTGENPLLHYCTSGFRAGLSPHPLFDVQMILRQCPEVVPAHGANPLLDFLSRHGAKTPRPHVLFDPAYYLDRNPDIADAPINAFLHYLLYGWREDRNPHPLFDNAFYRSQQDKGVSEICPLVHYVHEGSLLGLKPHPWFDSAFYLRQHPEVATTTRESALAHYLRLGHRLNYNPNAFFDSTAYLERYGDKVAPGMSPLEHAIEHGECGAIARVVRASVTMPAGSTENGAVQKPPDSPPLIAFYLPQYHPIEENDQWWGKGFTDWQNVARATAMFDGHYQPRVPADLGFYDLRLPEVFEQQAEIAREYGIHGFCYYYYWFDGRRLLERPLELMLERNSPQFPFCICWANENWCRNWFDASRDVLLEQRYSADFAERFLADAMHILTAPNYIRIAGRPLLLVFRADQIPDVQRVAEIWRRLFRQQTGMELHLSMVENPAIPDPRSLGFDSMVEFSPRSWSSALSPATVPGLHPEFRGRIEDYSGIVRRNLLRPPVDYPFYRCVMPGWDNTARRLLQARIAVAQSPEAYENWLSSAIALSLAEASKQEPLVFIYAWNEWAEGAYLEPDQKYGRAYLEATRNALRTQSVKPDLHASV